MTPTRARYVTACQQLLALGVVVMALVPATRVVSLDVVGVGPGTGIAQPSISVSPDRGATGSQKADMTGYQRGQQRCAQVSLRVAERRGPATLTSHRSCTLGRHPARMTRAGAG